MLGQEVKAAPCACHPGDHGSTFAGNPLVCHAACTVFDIINAPSFLASVEKKGDRLRAGEAKCVHGRVCDHDGSGWHMAASTLAAAEWQWRHRCHSHFTHRTAA